MLVFSQNRPMQLDLLLKTFNNCVGDFNNIDVNVLYHSTSFEFEQGYNICRKENLNINFIRQDTFYQDVKTFIDAAQGEYILFCTDDTIFTRMFLVEEIENVLDNNKKVLNFSLRLGKNTDYCYPLSRKQRVPFKESEKRILYWNWRKEECDFNYPLEVSSTILRINDVKKIVDAWNFPNPNWMEWYMDICKNNLTNKEISACFSLSVAFSAPMNKVNDKNSNKASGIQEYSPEKLLKKYIGGYRINPYRFFKYIPQAAHEEVEFKFIKTIHY
jgi:hypothetical protein